MWPRLDDRRPFLVVATALVALMWLSLWWWGQSPHGRFLSHEELGYAADIEGGYVTLVLLFVAGWTLMTVAMMLPTSLPLVALFYSFVRARPQRVRLTALLVLGYVGVWTFFGLAVHAGDGVLHDLVARSAWLETNAWAIGAGTVALAGAYQFTPLKYHCLDKCRSPLSFVMAHWHGGRGETEAFRLGVHHGLYCLGCCWSLMLLMFAVGVGNLGWMLAIGAVMAVEKNVPWGRHLSAPLGILLLGWGVVLVATETTIAGGA
jgi:predicted metal-binding membrane protein